MNEKFKRLSIEELEEVEKKTHVAYDLLIECLEMNKVHQLTGFLAMQNICALQLKKAGIAFEDYKLQVEECMKMFKKTVWGKDGLEE
jgi:hypothetical protein